MGIPPRATALAAKAKGRRARIMRSLSINSTPLLGDMNDTIRFSAHFTGGFCTSAIFFEIRAKGGGDNDDSDFAMAAAPLPRKRGEVWDLQLFWKIFEKPRVVPGSKAELLDDASSRSRSWAAAIRNSMGVGQEEAKHQTRCQGSDLRHR